MKIGTKLEEYIAAIQPHSKLYLQIVLADDVLYVYEIKILGVSGNWLGVQIGYDIRCNVKMFRGMLHCYTGKEQTYCTVQVFSQTDGKESTELWLVDAEQAVSMEPTLENAMLVLEQLATVERKRDAQAKV